MGVLGGVSHFPAQMPGPGGTRSAPSQSYPHTSGMHGTDETHPESEPRGKPRVLFHYPIDATFIQSDLGLLRRFCEVSPLHFTERSRYRDIARALREVDLVFSWFALGPSAVANVLARMFGKRSVTVAGGWDVSRMPEIGYGYMNRFRGRVAARLALRTANLVLAFSHWSESRIRSVAPRSRVRTAYMGVDANLFRPSSKELLVVTVANINRENLARKGLLDIVRAARKVSDVRFLIVGRGLDGSVDALRKSAGGNVEFPGRLPDDELRTTLARASVYLQPSYTEGFGVAIAEAMASGCVPVVTKMGAIPEVVGDAGIYVPYGRPEALATGIREGLTSGLGPTARQRVVENFTIEHRFAALRSCIRDVLPEGD